MTFTLAGQLPSGKNAVVVTRTGHRFPAKRFVAWRTDALEQVKEYQGLNIIDPVKLIIDYTPGDRRTRDIAGMLDAIGHLLERASILKSDGLIRGCEWNEFDVDKNRPQAVVTLKPLKTREVA